MNIETLRVFCDVVQHHSFSHGAKVNEVSQSAATQSVHRLERHFGVQLVDRTKRPFVLTPEGQATYEGFRELLELYDSVEAHVRSLRMEISGLVRVAAIYSVGLHDMSRCMQDFMRRFPKAKVRLEYLRPNKVYSAVLNGEVDLGIVSYPTPSPELNVIPLRLEPMMVVCPPGHDLAACTGITAEQLHGMDFVAFDRDLIIRKEIDRYLRQRSLSIRVVMEFDNIETIKQAVQIGAGISILPEPTVRDELQSKTLAAVRLISPELLRPIGIIHRQRKVFSPTAAKFVELLQKVQRSSDVEQKKTQDLRPKAHHA
jgi:DNA-binding transcriptional LysR family regulator